MLIYNYKKEFLGIDEEDLKILGLSTLADLRAEAADFADLFVKTPGHIHNFKHVHWIDYVLDKNGAEAKVIIHIKNKNYSAVLMINTAYLVDSPSEKAFSVVLSNIKLLSSSQTEKLLVDINEQPAPIPASGTTELFTVPGSVIQTATQEEIAAETSEVAFDPYEAPLTSSTIEDVYETEIEVEDLTAADAPHDEELEAMRYKEDEQVQEKVEIPEAKEEPVTKIPNAIKKVKPTSVIEGDYANYVYDPEVASEELGLPIDLIEEFIKDFISQALSFKDELYKSVDEEELDNIRIQSHKLKGVAANLRIEDALEALTLINTSSEYEDILINLDRFYLMIDKLSGKNTKSVSKENTSSKIVEQEDEDEDEFILSFKEDKLEEEILDSDVPETISVAELADDDFLSSDISNDDTDEDLSILDANEDIPNDDIQEEVLDIALKYDKELIANDIGIDIDSFNELFNDYINESKELALTISQSADNNDLTICKNLASKIKGMSENMRIHKLDSDLNDIINTTNTASIKSSVEKMISTLTELSAQE